MDITISQTGKDTPFTRRANVTIDAYLALGESSQQASHSLSAPVRAKMRGESLREAFAEELAKKLELNFGKNPLHGLSNRLYKYREPKFVYAIAEYAAKTGVFTARFIRAILETGGYSSSDSGAIRKAMADLGLDPDEDLPIVSHPLHSKPDAPFAHAGALKGLLEALQRQCAVVIFYGANGGGKTTVARQLTWVLAEGQERPFRNIVWIRPDSHMEDLTLAFVVDEIVKQLGFFAWANDAPDVKLDRLASQLRDVPTLIIIDEYVPRQTTDREALAGWLMRLPYPSKALLLTVDPYNNEAFRNSVCRVPMPPFTAQEAEGLIDWWLKDRPQIRDQMRHRDDRNLIIAAAQDFGPKIIFTALSLAERSPERSIESCIQEATNEDRGLNSLWNDLDLVGKSMLMSMTLAKHSASESTLRALPVGEEPVHVDRVTRQLEDSPFLKVSRVHYDPSNPGNEEKRYSIDGIVTRFLNGRVQASRGLLTDAARRWNACFHDYVCSLGEGEWGDRKTFLRVHADIGNFQHVIEDLSIEAAEDVRQASMLVKMILVLRQYWDVKGDHVSRFRYLQLALTHARAHEMVEEHIKLLGVLVRANWMLGNDHDAIEGFEQLQALAHKHTRLLKKNPSLDASVCFARLKHMEALRRDVPDVVIAEAETAYKRFVDGPDLWPVKFKYVWGQAKLVAGKRAEARRILESLLPQLESGVSLRYLIGTYVNLARAQSDAISAISYLNKAEELAQSPLDYSYRLGEIYLERAEFHKVRGEREQEVQMLVDAQRMFERCKRGRHLAMIATRLSANTN